MVSSSRPSSPWNTSACAVSSSASTAAMRGAIAASATPMVWWRAPAGLVSGPRKLNVVGTPSSRRMGRRASSPGGTRARSRTQCRARRCRPRPPPVAGRRRRPRLRAGRRTALAAGRAVAVLGDRDARGGRNHRGQRGHVERPCPVAARAARVQQRPFDLDPRANARIARARPVISAAVSPFIRNATRKPAVWAAVASPRMIVERAASLVAASRSSCRVSRARASVSVMPRARLAPGRGRGPAATASGRSRCRAGTGPGGCPTRAWTASSRSNGSGGLITQASACAQFASHVSAWRASSSSTGGMAWPMRPRSRTLRAR